MIVADTNLIAYLFLPGEHTASAEKVYKKDPVWLAPYLWRSELRNVLAMNVQRHMINAELAFDIIQKAQKLMLDHEYIVRSYQVLELCFQSNCTAYDCEYVALANDLDIPLVTFDKKVIRTFTNIAISANQFLNTKMIPS